MERIKKALLWILLSIPACLFGQQVKPQSAEISFSVKHALGATAEGTFKGFIADIVFDPARPEQAEISASIEAATFYTGNGLRDKNIKGEKYLDVKKYPKISMRALRIKSLGGNKYSGVFLLSIKNVSKQITFPFTYTSSTELQGVFSAEFSLNRLDFNVGESNWLLEDVVTLKLKVVTG